MRDYKTTTIGEGMGGVDETREDNKPKPVTLKTKA